VLVAALAKLAGCLLLFKILDLHFGRFPAWLASVLYALAPCALLEDVGYCCVTQSTLIWPVGAWLLVGRKRADGSLAQLPPWGCAALAFIAGQTDWLALVILPALAVLTLNWEQPWWKNISLAARNPRFRALALGGAASALVMAVQVVLYHPDLHDLYAWFALKAGARPQGGVSRASLLALAPLRLTAFVGLSLVLGALAGMFGRTHRRDPLLVSSLAFLLCFGGLVLLLPKYFYMERTVYVSLLFPAAALTSGALQRGSRVLASILAVISVPGVIYAHMMLSVPDYSPVARKLGEVFAKQSDIHDVVVTNIKPAQPPFKPSDITGSKAASIIADRRIYYGIEHMAQITELPKVLKRSRASLAFVVLKSRPLDSDLSEMLKRDAQLKASFEETLPISAPTLSERLRAFVWYTVMRKGSAPPVQTPDSGPAAFEIYRLELGQ
jgi:hypothetical protein